LEMPWLSILILGTSKNVKVTNLRKLGKALFRQKFPKLTTLWAGALS
jgi:hypothetical protein